MKLCCIENYLIASIWKTQIIVPHKSGHSSLNLPISILYAYVAGFIVDMHFARNRIGIMLSIFVCKVEKRHNHTKSDIVKLITQLRIWYCQAERRKIESNCTCRIIQLSCRRLVPLANLWKNLYSALIWWHIKYWIFLNPTWSDHLIKSTTSTDQMLIRAVS